MLGTPPGNTLQPTPTTNNDKMRKLLESNRGYLALLNQILFCGNSDFRCADSFFIKWLLQPDILYKCVTDNNNAACFACFDALLFVFSFLFQILNKYT